MKRFHSVTTYVFLGGISLCVLLGLGCTALQRTKLGAAELGCAIKAPVKPLAQLTPQVTGILTAPTYEAKLGELKDQLVKDGIADAADLVFCLVSGIVDSFSAGASHGALSHGAQAVIENGRAYIRAHSAK